MGGRLDEDPEAAATTDGTPVLSNSKEPADETAARVAVGLAARSGGRAAAAAAVAEVERAGCYGGNMASGRDSLQPWVEVAQLECAAASFEQTLVAGGSYRG